MSARTASDAILIEETPEADRAAREGREIATLPDARDLLRTLPQRNHGRPHLQYAVELLIAASERGTRASLDDVGAQLSRALTAEGSL